MYSKRKGFKKKHFDLIFQIVMIITIIIIVATIIMARRNNNEMATKIHLEHNDILILTLAYHLNNIFIRIRLTSVIT
jgi:hypothetical protein